MWRKCYPHPSTYMSSQAPMRELSIVAVTDGGESMPSIPPPLRSQQTLLIQYMLLALYYPAHYYTLKFLSSAFFLLCQDFLVSTLAPLHQRWQIIAECWLTKTISCHMWKSILTAWFQCPHRSFLASWLRTDLLTQKTHQTSVQCSTIGYCSWDMLLGYIGFWFNRLNH